MFPSQVTVGIRVHIISVGDIDTIEQKFRCDFYLSACWREPRLKNRSIQEVNFVIFVGFTLELSTIIQVSVEG